MLLLRQLNKGNFATNSSDSRLFPSLEVLVSHLFVSFQQVDGFQFHLQVAPVEVDGKVATESEPILLELTDFGVDFLYQRKNEFLSNKRAINVCAENCSYHSGTTTDVLAYHWWPRQLVVNRHSFRSQVSSHDMVSGCLNCAVFPTGIDEV